MTQSLAARVDGILGATAGAVEAFTTFATCRECGGPFTVDRTRSTQQAREAHLTCADCGTKAIITVTLTTPTGQTADTDTARLPIGPLERHLHGTPTDAAARLGITRTTFYRYRHDGIPADEADQLACAAGLHPAQVWGTAYYTATGTSEADVA